MTGAGTKTTCTKCRPQALAKIQIYLVKTSHGQLGLQSPELCIVVVVLLRLLLWSRRLRYPAGTSNGGDV